MPRSPVRLLPVPLLLAGAVFFNVFSLSAKAAARPLSVAGALSPPRAVPDDATAEAIARAAIATHLPWVAATLDLASIDRRDDGGRVVRFAQSIDGVRVEDRGARVLVDVDGVARIASASVEDRAPIARRAVLDAKSAVAGHRYRGFSLDAARARLVYVPTGSGPLLAWLVPADVPWELPLRPVMAVDAVTGARIFSVDRARRAKVVRVWPDNPVQTPVLTDFALPSLLDGTKTLTSATWDAFSCVDDGLVRPTTILGMPVSMHVCDVKHAATADAAGDFSYPRPPSDSVVDDLLAEASAAYHADRALRTYAKHGLPMLRKEARPLTVVANVRMPANWSSGPESALGCASCKLERLENAFYAPADPFSGEIFGVKGDGLFLGQGAKLDYSYDGDVVYHELGHAVVETTAKLVPYIHLDEQGAVMQPGSANEAIADFLSSTVTGDSLIGEYVSPGGIRDLKNSDTCPGTLTNEVHEDSLPFSGALWEARSALSAVDQAKFDRGVLLGLQLVPSGDISFADLIATFEKGVEKEAGAVASSLLATAAKKRGIDGCRRVRELPASGTSGWSLGFFAYGRPYLPMGVSGDLVPGHVQFHRTLPPGATSITVRWTGQQLPGDPAWLSSSLPFDAAVLVKFDAPIRWKGTTGDFTVRRDVDGTATSETISVPPGAKDVYLNVGVRGDGDGLYDDVQIDVGTSPVPPDGGPTPPPFDSGPAFDGGGLDSDPSFDGALDSGGFRGDAGLVSGDPPDDIVNGRVCGCEMPGKAGAKTTFAMGLLGLSLLAVARRRRRD